jgi:riboflavin kinase/FMN adenylyltransferase
VGDDFRFGRARSGDVALLREAGQEYGFSVDDMTTVSRNEQRISSTLIRGYLEQGDLEQAVACLGRPYSICGLVAHGDKRGRTIGFPTLNILLNRHKSPLRGVFAVRVSGIQGEDSSLPGVANIGNRPTVEGDDRYLLEVHLFDFNREIYAQHVNVEFVERIRDEMKFESFEALRKQIMTDSDQAKTLLAERQVK